jgi:hypothetical protein
LADKQLASNKGLMGGWDRLVLEIQHHIEVQFIVVIYAMGLGRIFLPDYLWESPQAACAFLLLLLGHCYLACDGKFREGGHVVHGYQNAVRFFSFQEHTLYFLERIEVN